MCISCNSETIDCWHVTFGFASKFISVKNALISALEKLLLHCTAWSHTYITHVYGGAKKYHPQIHTKWSMWSIHGPHLCRCAHTVCLAKPHARGCKHCLKFNLQILTYMGLKRARKVHDYMVAWHLFSANTHFFFHLNLIIHFFCRNIRQRNICSFHIWTLSLLNMLKYNNLFIGPVLLTRLDTPAKFRFFFFFKQPRFKSWILMSMTLRQHVYNVIFMV